MKIKDSLFLLAFTLFGTLAIVFFNIQSKNIPVIQYSRVTPTHSNTNVSAQTPADTEQQGDTQAVSQEKRNVVIPITDFYSRITKKSFGIHITPATSPVQPERFSGYHTGVDAETTDAEKNIDVPVYSLADGTIAFTGNVNGYGGVVVVYYTINGEKITALFGHVRLASVAFKKNDSVSVGEQIAVLGTGYSTETDGERKHLHLSLLPGHTVNYKGYTPTQAGLSAWMNPVSWLRDNQASEPK